MSEQSMPVFPSEPIERVQAGMQVSDATGQVLGKVVRVHHPPEAPGDAREPESMAEEMVERAPSPPSMSELSPLLIVGPSPFTADDLSHLPEEARHLLLRTGFIEVAGPNLHGAERFIRADRVRDVTEGGVVLH